MVCLPPKYILPPIQTWDTLSLTLIQLLCFLKLAIPVLSQTLPVPQPLQEGLAPIQVPTATAQIAPLSIPLVSAHAIQTSLSLHHVPAPPVTAQAPDHSASMLGPPGPPTFSGSLQPMQNMLSQHPQYVHLSNRPPNDMDLIMACAYGIAKPSLPVFKCCRESDFSLLKMALDNLLENHPHLTEQYKYQVLLEHFQYPGANKLARSSHIPLPSKHFRRSMVSQGC